VAEHICGIVFGRFLREPVGCAAVDYAGAEEAYKAGGRVGAAGTE
jgi:hypothetical protein